MNEKQTAAIRLIFIDFISSYLEQLNY